MKLYKQSVADKPTIAGNYSDGRDTSDRRQLKFRKRLLRNDLVPARECWGVLSQTWRSLDLNSTSKRRTSNRRSTSPGSFFGSLTAACPYRGSNPPRASSAG